MNQIASYRVCYKNCCAQLWGKAWPCICVGVEPPFLKSWIRHCRSFGLLRRVFRNLFLWSKKGLYLSIVRSHLLYCSPLWQPYLIKDIILLERVQCRASKYILGDYSSNYKTRLIKLNLLPLMYIYELLDILFFIKSLKSPNNSFNILHYISFIKTSTRSGGKNLFILHLYSNLTHANSYFCRISRLWNALPIINLASSPTTLKNKLISFYGITFYLILTVIVIVVCIFVSL